MRKPTEAERREIMIHSLALELQAAVESFLENPFWADSGHD